MLVGCRVWVRRRDRLSFVFHSYVPYVVSSAYIYTLNSIWLATDRLVTLIATETTVTAIRPTIINIETNLVEDGFTLGDATQASGDNNGQGVRGRVKISDESSM